MNDAAPAAMPSSKPCCAGAAAARGDGRGAAGDAVPSGPALAATDARSRTPAAAAGARADDAARRRMSPLVAIPAGRWRIGSDAGDGDPGDGEGPARTVELAAFSISPTAVTNAEFADFVRATGHVTQAERDGASFVFWLQADVAVRRAVRRVPRGLPWWLPVEGACWQRPEGPGSSLDGRASHPVVHVSWDDAAAYARWAGRRLPTEAEWEVAARGGLAGARFPWGDGDGDLPARCNTWRGEFPSRPRPPWRPATLPADALPPNGFGLHHAVGNVWQWCDDWFSASYHAETSSRDPRQRRPTGRRAVRGGSFLCHASYCERYRVAARTGSEPAATASHRGFRVAG